MFAETGYITESFPGFGNNSAVGWWHYGQKVGEDFIAHRTTLFDHHHYVSTTPYLPWVDWLRQAPGAWQIVIIIPLNKSPVQLIIKWALIDKKIIYKQPILSNCYHIFTDIDIGNCFSSYCCCLMFSLK